jgi:hypothetical protein
VIDLLRLADDPVRTEAGTRTAAFVEGAIQVAGRGHDQAAQRSRRAGDDEQATEALRRTRTGFNCYLSDSARLRRVGVTDASPTGD